MILNKCNFFSKCLKNHVDINILIPTIGDNESLNMELKDIYSKREPYKILYLLHGALEDCNSWINMTNIVRYLEGRNIVVVMPSGQNSFYSDMRHGEKYSEFITEELPLFIKLLLNISPNREDIFIAGCSMGGYGAIKAALLNPLKYGGFASLSGAIDLPVLEEKMKAIGFDFFRYDDIFGDIGQVENSDDDPYTMAKRINYSKVKPKAYVACGSEDRINYEMSIKIRDILRSSQIDVTFSGESGLHDWAYWDIEIKKVLEWIDSSNIGG